jgi:hypothetical protein
VRQLGETGVLPGQPSPDGWETSLVEIERWYIGLSGKEWADLVSNGQVDPLVVEVVLKDEVTEELLLCIFKSWERKGIVKIISHDFEVSENYKIILILCGLDKNIEKEKESLMHESLCGLVKSYIELAYRCENIVNKNPLFICLSNKRILILGIEDAMEQVSQREREIIRFYLNRYALLLSDKLQEEIGSKNRFFQN